MKNQEKLFEFVCQLIDIQIKKYVALPKIGIGPDARLNAQLVFFEVDELLGFAEQLITEMEKSIQEKPISAKILFSVFEQIKFYIEQERLRAYAGWLLDENNIHTPLMQRVNDQMEQLKEIAQTARIEYSPASNPTTEIQRQVQKDSVAIAFYILDLAKKISLDPSMELDRNIPQHAQVILRRNAHSRYRKLEFADPINDLHKQCEEFLSRTGHTKSDKVLEQVDAKAYEAQHKEQLSKLLTRYKLIDPSADLFSPWYEIGKTIDQDKTKSPSIFSSRNFMLFGGVATVGVVVVCMLMAYFSRQSTESTLKSTRSNSFLS